MGLNGDWQSKLAPPWLRRAVGAIIERDSGNEKDVQVDRMRQGVLANVPGKAPPDALDFIGEERGLPRAVSESPSDNGGTKDQAYAERLRTTWTALGGHSFAGSHGSILRALDRAGFPTGSAAGAHIIQKIHRYSYLSGAGGSVVFGTHSDPWTMTATPASYWPEFVVLFPADFTPPIGSVFQDGDPSADLLNGLVMQWKDTKAAFLGTIVVVTDPLIWDWPPGVHKWDDVGLTWDSGSTRFVKPPG